MYRPVGITIELNRSCGLVVQLEHLQSNLKTQKKTVYDHTGSYVPPPILLSEAHTP